MKKLLVVLLVLLASTSFAQHVMRVTYHGTEYKPGGMHVISVEQLIPPPSGIDPVHSKNVRTDLVTYRAIQGFIVKSDYVTDKQHADKNNYYLITDSEGNTDYVLEVYMNKFWLSLFTFIQEKNYDKKVVKAFTYL